MSKKIMSMIFIVIVVSSANADCIYKKQTYREGEIRDSFICHDGQWIKI